MKVVGEQGPAWVVDWTLHMHPRLKFPPLAKGSQGGGFVITGSLSRGRGLG